MKHVSISENQHALFIQVMHVATQLITTPNDSPQFPVLIERLRLTAARYHDLNQRTEAFTFECLTSYQQQALTILARAVEFTPLPQQAFAFTQLVALGLARPIKGGAFLATTQGLSIYYSRLKPDDQCNTRAKTEKSRRKSKIA